MPIPKPKKDESQGDYVGRCHTALADEYTDQKKRHAICMQTWRDRNKKNLLSVFTVAQDVELRRETLDGKEHIVLPLTALVQGTFQCANCNGPNFYPAAEFGKNPGAWNGRPVTIGHPQRNGNYVSAGDPDIWGTERIGTTFHARMEGEKLRVEAWIDPEAVERAGEAAGEVLAAAEGGDQVEVSTAAWIDEVPKVGSYAGRKYDAIQTAFQPDHIALLHLGDKGACSWEDGCGVRVASMADQTEPCCESCAAGDPCEELAAHQTARSREMAIEVALEGAYGFAYLVDHDDEWVYFAADGRKGLRRRRYTEDDDGNVMLAEDDDERVRPRTEFVAVNQEDGDMADDKQTKDRAASAPPPEKDSEHAKLDDRDKKIAEQQAEIEHLKDQISKPAAATLDEYLEQAPVELRDGLMTLHKAETRRRLELIDAVMKAEKGLYEEDELKAMKVADLERLAKLATRRSGMDYSIIPAEHSQIAALEDVDFAPTPVWDPSKIPPGMSAAARKAQH